MNKKSTVTMKARLLIWQKC